LKSFWITNQRLSSNLLLTNMAEEKKSEGVSIASQYPDVALPEVSVLDYLSVDWNTRPENLRVLVDSATKKTFNYSEIKRLIDGTAAAFVEVKGAKHNDVLGICAANCIEFLPAFLGFVKFGGIVSPLNNKYTPREIAYQLKDAGAKYLICDPSTVGPCIEGLNSLGADVPATLKEIYVFGDSKPASPDANYTVKLFSELVQEGLDSGKTVEAAKFDPKTQVLAIPYSSGTSGLSKGVELTHYNVVSNMAQFISQPELVSWNDDDVVLIVLPMYHIYGLTVLGLTVSIVLFKLVPANHCNCRV
jgi:acyl-CoA synthetase (AMP-forming)/AMP-acid ligase II